MSKEAMKLALDALETSARNWPSDSIIEAITALREALAEQPAQQEPVDWEAVAADQAMTIALLKAELQEFANKEADAVEVALTESGWVWDGDQWQRPAQRTWVGLTDERIFEIANEHQDWDRNLIRVRSFARAIEAKLKEKNT
jgi:hypothetical protein